MSQNLLYGLGYLPDTISTNLLGVLALMIYHVELKVPATWIGLAYLKAIMPACIADNVDPLIFTPAAYAARGSAKTSVT